MEPTVGMMVTTNLRLVEPLRRGGMGSVWVADHLGLDTRVAVKFIATEHARANPSLVARFKREAGVAAKIKNPHVVQVFDHGLTEDGTPYIAMELLEGESLEDRLARGTLAVREVAVLLGQVAQVLDKAHELGIVHRDIKPANIFLIESGYELFAKVLDFGIAKHADVMSEVSVTSTQAMMGSPLYMSPEQFTSAKGVDGRADLWSLAVVAYHALTGQPSFRGDTLGEVMMAVMQGRYAPPSALGGELPAGLDGWFARAFAADIAQRFQSGSELSQAFLAVAKGDAASGELLRLSSPDVGQVARTVGFDGPLPPAGGAFQGTLEPASATYGSGLARPRGASLPWGRLLVIALAIVGAVVGVVVMTSSLGANDPEPELAATQAPAPPAPAAPASAGAATEVSGEPEPDPPTAASSAASAAAGSAAPAPSATAPPSPAARPVPASTPASRPASKSTPAPAPPGGVDAYGF